MKTNKLLGVAAVMLGVSFGASAQSRVYTEATYLQLASTSHVSSGTTSSDGQVVAAISGYQLDENFSVEGMLGTGASSSDVKLNGSTQSTPVTSKLNLAYGVYARAKAALTTDADVFVRVGRSGWQGTASTSSASVSNNLYDWTYSAGVNYSINKSTYVTGSWVKAYDKNSIKVDGWSLGVGYRF